MKGNGPSKAVANLSNQTLSDTKIEHQILINNLRHAFHEARKIQIKLAYRAKTFPFFLSRNLRRCIRKGDKNLTEPLQVSKRANVLYRSVESNVPYRSEVEDIQCLWCRKSFYQFRNAYELLQHLTCCHPLLHFSIEAGTEYSISQIIINMRLLRDSGISVSKPKEVSKKLKREPLFQHLMFETTLVNKRKFNGMPFTADQSTDADGIPMKFGGHPNSKRPRRACRDSASTSLGSCTDPAVMPSSSNDSLVQQHNKGRASLRGSRRRGKGGRLSSAKMRDGDKSNGSAGRSRKITFNSIEEGARNGRLFHPIEQTRLHLEKFEMVDSDHEDETEQHWRFQIRHEELVDFTDTIPSEMLFMHLWNQFVGMEHKVESDGGVSKACMMFVTKYHRTMRRLKFEVSFIRFLKEMDMAGLIDANDVFNCVMKLKVLGGDSSRGDDVENEPPFIYEENLLRMLAKDIRKKKRMENKNGEENRDSICMALNSSRKEVKENEVYSSDDHDTSFAVGEVPSFPNGR